ncbi:MAG: nitroreductase family protein, partial [Mycobacterium sp.]
MGAARRSRAGGALVGELLAGIRAQRACRRFDPEGTVPDSDVEQMLAAAVHAPSAE